MTDLLLDTHILIWLALGERIGPETLQLVLRAPTVYVSAASIFELKIKQAGGKLPAAGKVIDTLDSMGITVLPLTQSHLSLYRLFHVDNRDPFDNALVATAISEKITLITADRQLLNLHLEGLETVDGRK